MKLSTGKKDKNVLSLYLNSSGDIVPSKENASEPIISFKENAKITDILTTKSAANLSMSKKQLINIETTVPGYKHGFVLQTGTGFSRKRDAYLFSDKYVSEKLYDNDLNAVGSAVVNKSAKSIQIALGELVSSVIKNVNEEYPNLKISLLIEQDDDHISGDLSRLKILVLSLLAMTFEVDILGEIKVTLRKRNGNQEIIFTTVAREPKFLNGVVDFCNAYPFSTTTAVLARALSNEMNITLSIFQEYDYLEMLVSFDKESSSFYGVYVEDDNDNMLYNMCMNVFFKHK